MNSRTCLITALVSAACLASPAQQKGVIGTLASSATSRCWAQETGRVTTRLFFRMVGASSNGPILPKSRSAWTEDRRTVTSNTGMADEGYTEYPFCSGLMDFSFTPQHAIYPRLISAAKADLSRVNSADLVVQHVYQPDGCVWGTSGREFVQTFTATKSELVSATLLVASAPGLFEAVVLEGGIGGKRLGPAKRFRAGNSIEWGTAYWQAGRQNHGGRIMKHRMQESLSFCLHHSAILLRIRKTVYLRSEHESKRIPFGASRRGRVCHRAPRFRAVGGTWYHGMAGDGGCINTNIVELGVARGRSPAASHKSNPGNGHL